MTETRAVSERLVSEIEKLKNEIRAKNIELVILQEELRKIQERCPHINIKTVHASTGLSRKPVFCVCLDCRKIIYSY